MSVAGCTELKRKQFQAVERCLEQAWPFVLYCLPGSDSYEFMAEPDESLALLSHREFFAVGFNRDFASRSIIRHRANADQVLCATLPERKPFPTNKSSGTTHEHYLRSVSELIEQLRRDGGKCVISNVFHLPVDASLLTDGITRLFEANPNAFRAVFATEADGCWIVASPELLLDADMASRRISSVSLAGTRRAGTPGPWDEKNIEEQAIVTRTISGTLAQLGAKPVCSERFSLRANLVEHLCTPISATLPADIQCAKVLDALSPTPAIAGYPRPTALESIAHTEQHQRRLYGGYFGLSNETRLLAHVTLRCAAYSPGCLSVFAGGGITPLSQADSEWDEINIKARQFAQCFKANS